MYDLRINNDTSFLYCLLYTWYPKYQSIIVLNRFLQGNVKKHYKLASSAELVHEMCSNYFWWRLSFEKMKWPGKWVSSFYSFIDDKFSTKWLKLSTLEKTNHSERSTWGAVVWFDLVRSNFLRISSSTLNKIIEKAISANLTSSLPKEVS